MVPLLFDLPFSRIIYCLDFFYDTAMVRAYYFQLFRTPQLSLIQNGFRAPRLWVPVESVANWENVQAYETQEVSSSFRAIRAANPIFRYDYKVGNYFPKDDTTNMAFLFSTITEVTGGIRKAS